ncbi:MAG: hypothetical protein AAFP76_11505 [Bacteroidota bacterium]
MGLKLLYIANILVAGWIGITSLFFPETAIRTVFENTYKYSEVLRVVGALWFSIAVLSVLGLWKPVTFSPVLLIQLCYKGGWLLVVAIPALLNNHTYPKGMAFFFVIWVIAIPLVFPWKTVFNP